MQSVEGAVIACAGLGSRLGMGLPKCMIEIGGQTILSRLIGTLRSRVPRIHVVVGYREDIVTEYCARHHRDVVLIRNPKFRDTNTAHSLVLGSVGFYRKVLYLDGDLLINEKSLDSFIRHATEVPLIVGTTSAKSSQAVFVSTQGGSDCATQEVASFCRTPPMPHEWANVFAGRPDILSKGSRYVYECLEPHLPATMHELELFEIDTADDLARAKAGLASIATTKAG